MFLDFHFLVFIYRVMENRNYFVVFYSDVAEDVDKKIVI